MITPRRHAPEVLACLLMGGADREYGDIRSCTSCTEVTALAEMASNEVLKEGFLVKKGHVRHNWRTRWFVLEKKQLSYFRKRKDLSAAGVIPLVGATLECPPPDTSKKPWILLVKTHDGKEFMIQAPDDKTRTEWSGLIEECIRRLDPTKIGTVESLSRTMSTTSGNTLEMQRDMVKAMQDPEAGIKLTEIGLKHGKGITKYFTGKDVIDWLLSWSFAKDRSLAISIATDMLRNGFFHTINLDTATNILMLSKDGVLSREIVDNEEAKYIFVSMTSSNCTVFESDDDSSSNSDDDILTSSTAIRLGNETGFDGRIIKQGFLLKKSKVLKEWKPRRFVLKEKSAHLFFYRGSKDKKYRGAIQLSGLTIYELDNEIESPTDINGPPDISKRSKKPRDKENRILLITASGERIVLEAITAEERNAWIGEIRVAVSSLEINV